jgi:hypothetical protein
MTNSQKLSQIDNIAKILKVSPKEILDNSKLFEKIEPFYLHCLDYLVKIEDEKDKNVCLMSLEFIANLKQSPF